MPWRNYSEPWRNAQRDRAVATSPVQADLSQGGLELPRDQKFLLALQAPGSEQAQGMAAPDYSSWVFCFVLFCFLLGSPTRPS